MHSAIEPAVGSILAGQDPSEEQLESAITAMMSGEVEPAESASLLTAVAVHGVTVEALVGAARAMRRHAARITTQRNGLLDTCGTGGSGLNTFNISTAVAIVAAAAGVPVAKHGNRKASSSTGSADVLEALGVNIMLSPEAVGRCIDEVGIGFCFARTMHQAMKLVAPVRSALGFPTLFNWLGPLTNPAGAQFQLLGTTSRAAAEKVAAAAARLGTERTIVVTGEGGLDEVSLWGKTWWVEATPEGIRSGEWTAADFGVRECDVADVQAGSAEESATLLRGVFSKHLGPARDIVVANAAVALLASGTVGTVAEGSRRAQDVLDEWGAAEKLEELCRWTQASATGDS